MNPYPVSECGGEPKAQQNLYWYAVHGVWDSNDHLSINFQSAKQIWASGETRLGDQKAGSFSWRSSQIDSDNNKMKLVQTFGLTNYGVRRADVDMADLVGSGSVHVLGVEDGTDIHVRVKGDGFVLEQVSKRLFALHNTSFLLINAL
jgi:hypothetical protein